MSMKTVKVKALRNVAGHDNLKEGCKCSIDICDAVELSKLTPCPVEFLEELKAVPEPAEISKAEGTVEAAEKAVADYKTRTSRQEK